MPLDLLDRLSVGFFISLITVLRAGGWLCETAISLLKTSYYFICGTAIAAVMVIAMVFGDFVEPYEEEYDEEQWGTPWIT